MSGLVVLSAGPQIYRKHSVPTGRDYAMALEAAAKAGDAKAMNDLGWHYVIRGSTLDYAKAKEWFEKTAAAGNSAGMDNVGPCTPMGLASPRTMRRRATGMRRRPQQAIQTECTTSRACWTLAKAALPTLSAPLNSCCNRQSSATSGL